MTRRKILFVSPGPLKNPKRGTPLRIYNFLRQIRKPHDLIVCAQNVEPDLADIFWPYPNLSGFKKLFYFRNLVKEKKIEIVLTSTEVGIKLPVFLKWFNGVKIAIDLHGLYAEERYFKGTVGRLGKFFYETMVKFFLQFYDQIFVVAGKLKNYYENINRHVVVIYGGFNPAEFQQPRMTRENNTFTIGYMGNTRNYQGLDFLLEAASQLRQKSLFEFRLKLILSGQPQELLRMLKEKKLDDITQLNFDLDHENVNQVIRQTDVLTIPRPSQPLTEYAYPSKLPENLAVGVPLILTDVGPVGELLQGQNVCIIIGSQEIASELEEAVIKVYKMTKEEREKMGSQARQFVMENLTWKSLGKKINEALAGL